MESLIKIREMLMDELDHCAQKDQLSNNSLFTVDKITHAIKSIDTIMAMEDAGYSNDGYSMRGNSYARRNSRGRYSRDSYGGNSYRNYSRGYSRDEARDELVNQLRDIAMSSDGESKQLIESWIRQVEQG